MDDVARPVAENRVVAILTFDGKASCPALLEAIEFGAAEIPAARPLAKIPADGGALANLRRRGVRGSRMQRGIRLANQVTAAQISQCRVRADHHPLITFPDVRKLLDGAN